MDDIDNFDLLSAEKVAAKYGGDKRKIGEAAQMGLVNPTVAVMAGMFIDRMRAAAVKEQQPTTTVAQDTMTPPVQTAGLGATSQANTQMAAVPTGTRTLAEGGLSSLPVDEDMFPDEYAGGGIVAFQTGGPTTPFGRFVADSPVGRFASDLGKKGAEELEIMSLQDELRRKYGSASNLPGLFMSQTDEERQRAKDIMRRLGRMDINELRQLNAPSAVPIDQLSQAQQTGTDSIDTLRAKAAASRASMNPQNRAMYDENIFGMQRIAEDVAPKGKSSEKADTAKAAKAAAPTKEETSEDFLARRKRMLGEAGVSADPFAADREALRARMDDIASQDKENKALAMIMGGLSGVNARNLAEFAQKAGTAGFGQYMKGEKEAREDQKEIDKITRDINKAEDAMKRGDVDKALEFEDKAKQREIQLRGVQAQERAANKPTTVAEYYALQKKAEAGDPVAQQVLRGIFGGAKLGQVDERQLRADWDKMTPGAKMLLARNENITTFDQYKASRMGGGAGAPAAGADPLGLRGGR